MNEEKKTTETEEKVEQTEVSEEATKKEKKAKKKSKKDEEIEALSTEVNSLKEQLLRNQAELQNFKRRMNEERIKERKFANAEFAKNLLPILDNFDIALAKEENASNLKGFEMIRRDLFNTLKEQGLSEVEAFEQPFDPNYHQAVMKEAHDSYESNIVIEVFQKGYTFKDRLIRPAMVKVSE